MGTRRRIDPLLAANLAFLAAVVLHNSDHLFFQERGAFDASKHVLAAGSLLLLLTPVTVALAAARHRLAPLAAAVVGLSAALGVTATHVLPYWSAFSDPYGELHMDAYSWTVMLLEVAAGAVLGLTGLRALRTEHQDQRELTAA